jgi:DUF4097 and DUF4098 domain-containing protein YvlB
LNDKIFSLEKKMIRRMGFILISAILLSGAHAVQELRKEGRYFVTEIIKTFTVTGKGSIQFDDIFGDVDVETWEKREVYIREYKKMDVFTEEEAEAALERSKSSYRQTGNVITIDGSGSHRDWIRSEFQVKLPADFDVAIDTRGGDVSVVGPNGNVEVKTSGGDVELRSLGGMVDAHTSGGDMRAADIGGKTSLQTSGGDLELENIRGPLHARTSGGSIQLIRANDIADLHTSGGDIAIENVKGRVIANTSGGDIEVVGTSGEVEVNTSGGDISLENVGGGMQANTAGGDIEGRTISGSARVSTSGGSIELIDVRGGVDGRTAGGDISVEVTLRDFSKPHTIELRTAGGEIELAIPEKLPATIYAEIRTSDRWDSYNIYSDFPIRISKEGDGEKSRGSRTRITGDGEINGGGDPIRLMTADGDIHIKKIR